jgi:SAM-dependent methyltransferase
VTIQPAEATVACPVCRSAQTEDLGAPAHRIPRLVAGVPIKVSDLHLRHRRCPACEYQFVWPRIPQERLIECYRRSADHWGTGHDVIGPRFYAHKKDVFERFAPEKSALDFGCYDGGFLDYLGPAWRKAGIEPSQQAAEAARQRAVDVIAPTLDALDVPFHAGKFGGIIIFDVMEHLPDPVSDLARLRELLMPGGIILIETGDTDSIDWKRFGKRHPYAGNVEHIGFFNRKSIEAAGRRAGLSLAHFEHSIHTAYGTYVGVHRLYLWAYRAIRTLDALHFPLPQRTKNIAAGPVPRGINPQDHFLAVLRRDA